jgi:aryl-alcohol dehydrogenase-like predicted oxidoreductase
VRAPSHSPVPNSAEDQGARTFNFKLAAMKYRQLGHTGLAISEIGFGCGTSAGMMVSGPAEVRRAAIERALERGITLFDTAPVYGDTLSELHLGQALRKLGAKPVIATKVALETSDYDDLAGGVVRSIEGSLERLGVDVLPIVHMHNRVGPARMSTSPYGSGALLTLDDVLGPGGVVEGFERAQKRGLVRFIGCQAFGGDNALVETLIESGKFDSIILNYSLLNQSAFLDGPTLNPLFTYDRVGARAAARGMGIVALRALEAGALATGFARHPLAADHGSPDYAEHIRQAETLRFLAEAGDATLVPAAIRFVLANPAISTVLVGISDIAHVDAAADAQERGPLDAAQLLRIEALRSAGFQAPA